jgi:pimeloyl-ACP methyl ester carboxylesterase
MFPTSYKHEIEAAKTRVHLSGSRTVDTPSGQIEYVAYGGGLPILWVHGIFGGSDQGPQMSEAYLGKGFRTIAISRFGYLDSPLPRDSSPAAQADIPPFRCHHQRGRDRLAGLRPAEVTGKIQCLGFQPDRGSGLVYLAI